MMRDADMVGGYVTPDRPKRQPPPRRNQLLGFIRLYVADNGRWPTARQMADHMGWKNEGSVGDALSGLVRDGQLRMRKPANPRGRLVWELV